MDSVKHLLSYIFTLAFGILCAAIIYWLFTLIFPAVTIKTLFQSTATSTKKTGGLIDLLPDPRSNQGLLTSAKTPDPNTNLFNGYGYGPNKNQSSLVSYTNSNGNTTNNATDELKPPAGSPVVSYATNKAYVRSLSLYAGGHTYSGFTFTGEARTGMFLNNAFRVVLADPTGRVVSETAAIVTADWAAPGWKRFQVRLGNIVPQNIPCNIFFEQAKEAQQYTYVSAPTSTPAIRVVFPVLCN
jgi:hypothetical protein